MAMDDSTPPGSPGAAPVFSARLDPEGAHFSASPSLPLLQSALLAGVAMDSSCRNGTCRTCIRRLASGQVAYRIEWPGLSAEEKATGYILPCVAYPLSDVVIGPAD
jgi:ferredoxin